MTQQCLKCLSKLDSVVNYHIKYCTKTNRLLWDPNTSHNTTAQAGTSDHSKGDENSLPGFTILHCRAAPGILKMPGS